MREYESELNSIEFAGWWMRRLRESLAMARDMAKADPDGARCLLGPASGLAEEILATQATIDELTDQIQDPVSSPAHTL